MAPLINSRLRIDHTRDKFGSLKEEISVWMKANPFTLQVGTNVETSEQACRVFVDAKPPVKWSLIVSNIIHQFRSALDNAVYDLTISHSGGPLPGSEFPIFSDERDFNLKGRRKIRGIPSECQAFIKGCQPFEIGSPETNLFWALHNLSNIDKHRTIHLIDYVSEVVAEADVSGAGSVQATDVWVAPPGPLKSDTVVARWKPVVISDGSVDVKVLMKRQIIMDIDQPIAANNRGPLSILNQLGRLMHETILRLEYFHT